LGVFCCEEKKARKTNSLVHFLGESTAHQSEIGLSDLYLLKAKPTIVCLDKIEK
jgi:hypothetical protein